MDALIKNNIIKKNKLAVDIGTYAARVLEIHYAAKKVTVTASKEINSKDYTDCGEISFSLFAAKIDAEMSGQGRGDVMVSVPGDLCENKIITVKNKKESEIPKIIKKDYMTFGRVNPVSIHLVYTGIPSENAVILVEFAPKSTNSLFRCSYSSKYNSERQF